MYNKIDPRQINLHDFSSPNGDLHFTQTESEVFVDFSTGITGSFNIEGGLYVNGGQTLSIDSSNFMGGTATMALGGRSNWVSGVDSVVVGGVSNEVSGTRNMILNGNSNQITDTATDSTILAGYGGLITGFDGAVLIADGRVATKGAIDDNTLNINFENGVFIENDVYVDDDIYFGGSGLSSGDFNVLGTMYYTGLEVSTLDFMSGHVFNVSGVLNTKVTAVSGHVLDVSGILNSSIVATGQEIHNRLIYDLDDLVRQTGDQFISGTKTFYDLVKLDTGVSFASTGTSSYNTLTIQDNGTLSSTGKNMVATSADSLVLLLDADANGYSENNNFSSVWNNSFSVGTGSSVVDQAGIVFSIHPSGTLFTKDSLIINEPSFVPSTPTDPGFQGQMVWEADDQGHGFLYLNTGARWVRFTGSAW